MKSIDQVTMAVNATIGRIVTLPPTVAGGYLDSASQLYEAVKALKQLDKPLDRAFALLAGFSLECALKAHLAKYGITEKQLSNRPYGHDLCGLWRKASETGLALPLTPPQWVSDLNMLHCGKYQGRYPVNIHGTVWPIPDDVETGIKDVLVVLRAST